MKIYNIFLLITPDVFTGLLISVLGFLLVVLFNKAMKAFESLTDLRMTGGLVQKDMVQAQKDIEQGRKDTLQHQQCIEKIEKEIAEIKYVINRRNHGNN